MAEAPILRREWHWHFDLPPEKIWPVLADTARFNEAARAPTYQLEEIARPDGTVLRKGAAKVAGMAMAWEEKPYEWVLNKSFRQVREFSKGPFKRFGPIMQIEPEGSGSKVTYAFEAQPATLLGRLTGDSLMGKAGAIIERLAREAVGFLKGQSEEMFDFVPPTPPPGARERVDAAVAALEQGPYAHGLARKLGDLVLNGLEMDVGRLRPITLARRWNVPVRHAVELCLAGVRAGLLGMRWDLLCTSCRGAKLSVGTLDQLPTGAHCSSCNIDYERNFARNVELVFFPNAAVRPINAGGYCLSGPMTTPHVLAQQILQPGETRPLELALPPGPYRVRALTGIEALDFEHDGGTFPDVVATDGGFALQPGTASGHVNFINRRNGEVVLLLESRAWVADALTAPRRGSRLR